MSSLAAPTALDSDVVRDSTLLGRLPDQLQRRIQRQRTGGRRSEAAIQLLEAGFRSPGRKHGIAVRRKYWSYQGELGATEILAIDQQPTIAYGVQTGYKVNGRLVSLTIEMRALKSNAEAAEEFEKILPTVTIDGEKVPSPSFR
jgi:hypothetical protein